MRAAKLLLAGAAVFVAVHYVLAAKQQAWFGGRDPPWFMNSMGTVRFTIATFAVAGLLASLPRRRGQPLEAALAAGGWIAVGAAVPMVVRLFTMPGGPGNLFPIAIAIGFIVIAFGSEAGAAVGWWLRQRLAH